MPQAASWDVYPHRGRLFKGNLYPQRSSLPITGDIYPHRERLSSETLLHRRRLPSTETSTLIGSSLPHRGLLSSQGTSILRESPLLHRRRLPSHRTSTLNGDLYPHRGCLLSQGIFVLKQSVSKMVRLDDLNYITSKLKKKIWEALNSRRSLLSILTRSAPAIRTKYRELGVELRLRGKASRPTHLSPTKLTRFVRILQVPKVSVAGRHSGSQSSAASEF